MFKISISKWVNWEKQNRRNVFTILLFCFSQKKMRLNLEILNNCLLTWYENSSFCFPITSTFAPSFITMLLKIFFFVFRKYSFVVPRSENFESCFVKMISQYSFVVFRKCSFFASEIETFQHFFYQNGIYNSAFCWGKKTHWTFFFINVVLHKKTHFLSVKRQCWLLW